MACSPPAEAASTTTSKTAPENSGLFRAGAVITPSPASRRVEQLATVAACRPYSRARLSNCSPRAGHGSWSPGGQPARQRRALFQASQRRPQGLIAPLVCRGADLPACRVAGVAAEAQPVPVAQLPQHASAIGAGKHQSGCPGRSPRSSTALSSATTSPSCLSSRSWAMLRPFSATGRAARSSASRASSGPSLARVKTRSTGTLVQCGARHRVEQRVIRVLHHRQTAVLFDRPQPSTPSSNAPIAVPQSCACQMPAPRFETGDRWPAAHGWRAPALQV